MIKSTHSILQAIVRAKGGTFDSAKSSTRDLVEALVNDETSETDIDPENTMSTNKLLEHLVPDSEREGEPKT